MKKILLSVLVVGAIGGTVFAATNAFFSDTQTSTGNTFTAGTLTLKVDSTQSYNGNKCIVGPTALHPFVWSGTAAYPVPGTPCDGTWLPANLGAQKFFKFADIKPGDSGENTISLHVVNNDAWACVDINNFNVVPGNTNGAVGTGQLGNELQFFAWNDINCDNVFNAPTETKLFSQATGIGNASDVLGGKTYALADSSTGTPLSGGPISDLTKTHCIGLSWCAGTMTVNLTTGAISCDGSTMGNEAQGDSVLADIAFRVVQSRNNLSFRCNPPVLDYLDIGNTSSEVGHNLGGWSNAWVKPGWGGTYGGGSSDSSLRLLMGQGDPNACTDAARPATFTMNAGAGTATKLTLEHLDGAVNDSFDVKINGNPVGHYTATSTGGSEVWKITTFTFPGVTGTVTVELDATNPVASWCADWGQVAFSNAKLE